MTHAPSGIGALSVLSGVVAVFGLRALLAPVEKALSLGRWSA